MKEIVSEVLLNKERFTGCDFEKKLDTAIAEALKNYGESAIADEIEQKSCAIIEKYFRQYGTFFEYYDADDSLPPIKLARKGYYSPDEVYHQALRDYGWTATLYIDNQLSRKRNN